MRVEEVKDAKGNVYGYKCPECKQIHPYESIAEECLATHAKVLLD
mgnify:CR=1 FL=1|jgi:phage FluMu protein Com